MNKFLSRKFILTALTVLAGVATALVGVGGKVGIVAGIAAAILPTIIYVVTEGKIDEKAVSMIQQDVQEVVQIKGTK